MSLGSGYMTAREAAAELGITRATLYAYVSRGLVRSEAQSGSRARLYRVEDIRALAQRKAPEPAGTPSPLDWGAPVLDSRITLITEGALYYRGRDAATLCISASVENVATLLWGVDGADPFGWPAPDPIRFADGDGGDPVQRCLARLPLAGAVDERAFNLQPAGVAQTGARLVRWVASMLTGTAVSPAPINEQLAAAWDVQHQADLLRAALVLCADHELNSSTFAVRVVASTGASPYAAVQAGLAALSGPRHGGMTHRVDAVLPGLLDAGDPRAALAARMARGEDLPGFGHRLYPSGDPRGAALLQRMASALPETRRLRAARVLAGAAAELAGCPPSIDFALSLLSLELGLPLGSAQVLFAAGRTVGWVGHAIEQYQTGRLIRPRARYAGLHP